MCNEPFCWLLRRILSCHPSLPLCRLHQVCPSYPRTKIIRSAGMYRTAQNIIKQDHINSAKKKNTTELFEVYREHLKTGVTKSKLLKFSHTKFQRNMWSYTRIQFMVPVQVRYYNELIWLETEFARFSSGSLEHNFTETCRMFYGIHGQGDGNWTITRRYTRKS